MDNKKIFLAPGAHIVGNVSLGENVGIWYNAVVRADMESTLIYRIIVHCIQEMDFQLLLERE